MSKPGSWDSGPRWFRASERATELLIVSELVTWVSHWDPMLRRSRRCPGARDCALCAMGSPRVTRGVVLAIDTLHREVLLELRERHREAIDRMMGSSRSLVGWRVRIRKEGAAKNAAVHIHEIGCEYAVAHQIERLVESLGLPPLRLGERVEMESDSLQRDGCNLWLD